MTFAAVLVLLAGITFIPYTVAAWPRRQEIRARLEDELASRSPKYSASDIQLAVLIGLIGLLVVSVLLVLAEVRAMQQVRGKRRGARTWLVVLTVLHLPIIAMSPFIRDGGPADAASAAGQGALLALAVLLCFAPRVTRWLVATQRQGPIPLRTRDERQS